jgi:hypothetical protein
MKSKKKTISKKSGPVRVCHKSDVDDIREGLKEIASDDELFMQTLIDAGIYDKNMKLTKSYQ